jgi:hypothetical protein
VAFYPGLVSIFYLFFAVYEANAAQQSDVHAG